MSIVIHRDGRKIYDDDFAVQLNISDTVLVRDVVDHLELVAQVPSMFGNGTSGAARGAINLIYVLAEMAGIGNIEDLGIDCKTRVG